MNSKENTIITIVIPTYNRGHLIIDSIESVVNQTYQNWELIIVDDGSTDDTEETIKPYLQDNRINFVSRPLHKLKGANACRNFGLSLAKGEYIKWLDSDDLLVINCLERQLELIVQDEADVNICQSEFFNSGNECIEYNTKTWGELYSNSDLGIDLISGKIRWQTAAGLWKKSLFQTNPFNEEIQNSQEWLFHIQCGITDLKYSFTHDVLVLVRAQSGSMSSERNKDGKYYYSSSLARYFAIEQLFYNKFPAQPRLYLLRKFFWFQIFTLYKGNLKGFIKLIFLWPKIFYKSFFKTINANKEFQIIKNG